MKPPDDRPTPRLQLVDTEQNDTDELGTEGNGNGNGHAQSWHPEAVAVLAQHTAAKQVADEAVIDRLDRGLADLREGRTPWQRDVKDVLATMANQMHALTLARVVWPSLMAAALLVLGGFCGVIVLRLMSH